MKFVGELPLLIKIGSDEKAGCLSREKNEEIDVWEWGLGESEKSVDKGVRIGKMLFVKCL